MLNFLSKIGDSKQLATIIDSVPLGDRKEFEKVLEMYYKYDPSFLWLLCYAKEGQPINRKYIEEGYKKYKQVLDSDFPRLLSLKGNFESRMWELILCDVLSASGDLQHKKSVGADFILKSTKGRFIQVEAVAPNESDDTSMRAARPDYSEGNIFESGGLIHDHELPVVLRTLQAFGAKKDSYDKSLSLVIAINSYKAVGTTSDDSYVLRRFLFGLGNLTLTKTNNSGYQKGFEQLPHYNKPGEEPFLVSYFKRPEYSHVSGIIYTSQNPLGFIPGRYSWSWQNSGITFVPNPMATHPVELDFPYFRKILCNEECYKELEPEKEFQSSIPLDL